MDKFPLEGPVLVCFNHKSNWDVALTATMLPRKLCFMAKKELFDIFFISYIVKIAGSFPVSRGVGDIGAIKAAMSALKENKAIAMFPEGTRVKKGGKHTAKPGIAMIAAKSGAPMLPVGIHGNYRPFSTLTLTIGDPVYAQPPEGGKLTGEDLQEISDAVLNQILTMAGE